MNQQENTLQIQETEIVNDLLLIKWSPDEESLIPLRTLRDNCPCASCAGEKDVFGNVYKGPPLQITEASYHLTRMESVGYYALRPFWADGHNTGIFSVNLLKILGDAET